MNLMEKESQDNILLHSSHKRNYLVINLIKNVKDFYKENGKELKKM